MDMSLWWPASVCAAGVAGVAAGRWSGVTGRRRTQAPAPEPVPPHPLDRVRVEDLVDVLRSGVVVLGMDDEVVTASHSARSLGLVRGRDLVHAPLRELAREARKHGHPARRSSISPAAISASGAWW